VIPRFPGAIPGPRRFFNKPIPTGRAISRIGFFLALAAIFWVSAAPAPRPASAAEGLMSLLVSGVRDETGDPDWQDQLIAMGISNLIAEELYNTGRFVPLETNPEIRERIQTLVAATWSETDQARQAQLMEEAQSYGSDAIAHGVVRNFRKKRSRSFAGPFSKAKVKISFNVELTVDVRGEAPVSAVGTGKGVTRSKGLFFRVREDKIRFDKTTLGSAAHEAVREAVRKLYPEQ
jgi:hypothetical protein